MKISEKVRLATGLIQKSNSGAQKVEKMAQELETTPHFLQQISGQLRKSGLLNTIHGPGGGVVQPKDKTSCTMFEICLSLGSAQTQSNDPIQAKLNDFLKTYTVFYNTVDKANVGEVISINDQSSSVNEDLAA
jgi:DNA-binding IscR family transcriptional regulator